MENLLAFVFLLFASSCVTDTKPVRMLDFGTFTLMASPDWKKFDMQGIDSKVGGIRNKNDELKYDYGWFSYRFEKETTNTHVRMNTTIDGKSALIVKPKKKGNGLIGVYIQVDDLNRFSMSGTSKNDDEIIRIFESIKF